MRKREIFMLTSLAFSMGVVLGFMLSPVKQGIIVAGGHYINDDLDKQHFRVDESK